MLGAAALGGMAVVALAVTGASPAPATDLAEVLAAPPAAAYAELARSPTVAEGAYDFTGYAAYLEANDPFATAEPLNPAGFTRAFARTWLRPPQGTFVPGLNPRRILSELVEEYTGAAGSAARFEQLRTVALSPGQVRIDSAGAVPGSVGLRVGLPNGAPFDELFRVFFAKGNAVYIVDMISGTDDLTADVVAQARAEDQVAPAFTIPPAQSAAASPTTASRAVRLALSWQVIALIALGVGIAAFAGLTVVQRRLEAQSPPRPFVK